MNNYVSCPGLARELKIIARQHVPVKSQASFIAITPFAGFRKIARPL